MNRTLARLITTSLIAAVGVLTPTTSQASGRPAPSDIERFYCHRIVPPVAMDHPPKPPANRAHCLQRPKQAQPPAGSRRSMSPGIVIHGCAGCRPEAPTNHAVADPLDSEHSGPPTTSSNLLPVGSRSVLGEARAHRSTKRHEVPLTSKLGKTNLMLGEAARVHVGEVPHVEARGVLRDQPQVPAGPLPGESRRVLPAMPQMRP